MSEHCFFCGHALAGPDRRCESCGAVRESSDEKRVRAPCPRCHGVRLSPFALGPVALQTCTRCKGSFVSTDDWDVLLEAFLDKPLPEIVIAGVASPSDDDADGSPYRTAAPAPIEDAVQMNVSNAVRCPTCDDVMDRLEFAGISGVVVDVCKLHGLWLDAGELERIVDVVRKRAAPPPVVPERPRVTVAHVERRPADPAAMASLVASLRESAQVMAAEREEDPPMIVPPDRRDEQLTTALRPLRHLWRRLYDRLRR